MPYDLTLIQPVESFIDVVQLSGAGQKTVHWKPALQIQLHKPGDIALGNAAPHVASTHDALLADEGDRMDCESMFWVGKAGRCRCATTPGNLVGQIKRFH